jgi:glycerophosphoryl diester phosphodiesterase
MIARRFAYLDAPTPLAFAHRGGAADGDENTVAAFGRAVKLGYRYLETDTHATADGVAVVFHDHTLARIAGRPERIRALSWAQLSRIRVDGEQVVPRLSDVLDAWPDIRFNIDVKDDAAVEPTLSAVRAAGAQDRVLLASFSDARTARMRAALGPSVATSLGSRGVAQLWAASRAGRGAARIAGRVAAAQVPPRQGPLRVVDERFVRYAHRLGLQVHVWTIDAPDRMNELLDLGVDGIMTDRIDVLRDVYTTRGCWPA